MGNLGDLDRRHEADLAAVLGGRVTPGSGNRRERLDVWVGEGGDSWSTAVSAKSAQATGRSPRPGVRITGEVWREAELRAAEAGRRPALAVRLYGRAKIHPEHTPVGVDLVAVSVADYAEMRREVARLREVCPLCGFTNAECEFRGGHMDPREFVRSGTRRFA